MQTPIGNINTVIFDADGTLWDFKKVMRHALCCTLAELEKISPACRGLLSPEKMSEIRDRTAQEFDGQAVPQETIRLESFKRTLVTIGNPDDDLAAYLTAFYLKRRFEDIELYDDVKPVFARLQTKLNLALLTNGNTYPDRCGLAGCFRFTVFGQDYGLKKPDPRLFEIALSRAGCNCREILVVGDSLVNDAGGAKQAGMLAAWLNRDCQENSTAIQPDLVISSLAELPPLLGL